MRAIRPFDAIGMPIYDRMPVLLPKDFESEWLDPHNADSKELLSMLKPYPANENDLRVIDPSKLQVGNIDKCLKDVLHAQFSEMIRPDNFNGFRMIIMIINI
jgi:putative SOS response-associated peptidase YedK